MKKMKLKLDIFNLIVYNLIIINLNNQVLV